MGNQCNMCQKASSEQNSEVTTTNLDKQQKKQKPKQKNKVDLSEEEQKAAIKIQSRYKGNQARKEVGQLKQKKQAILDSQQQQSQISSIQNDLEEQQHPNLSNDQNQNLNQKKEQNIQEIDPVFNILVIGSNQSGKSSLIEFLLTNPNQGNNKKSWSQVELNTLTIKQTAGILLGEDTIRVNFIDTPALDNIQINKEQIIKDIQNCALKSSIIDNVIICLSSNVQSIKYNEMVLILLMKHFFLEIPSQNIFLFIIQKDNNKVTKEQIAKIQQEFTNKGLKINTKNVFIYDRNDTPIQEFIYRVLKGNKKQKFKPDLTKCILNFNNDLQNVCQMDKKISNEHQKYQQAQQQNMTSLNRKQHDFYTKCSIF